MTTPEQSDRQASPLPLWAEPTRRPPRSRSRKHIADIVRMCYRNARRRHSRYIARRMARGVAYHLSSKPVQFI